MKLGEEPYPTAVWGQGWPWVEADPVRVSHLLPNLHGQHVGKSHTAQDGPSRVCLSRQEETLGDAGASAL